MARRSVGSPKFWQKYPYVTARTSSTWTTRYYHRKIDPIFQLSGLATTPDDYHKPTGSSPYLSNIRVWGQQEEQQRAQVMSRKGARLIQHLGEHILDRDPKDADTYLGIWEGRAIEYALTHNDNLTGISLFVKNPDRIMGALEVTIRHPDTQAELANAVLVTDDIPDNEFKLYNLHMINTVAPTEVLVRLRVIDSVVEGETPGQLQVLSLADGSHQVADYELPNRDSSLEEVPYDWRDSNLVPLTGTMTSSWQILNSPTEFRSGGNRHLAIPISHDGTVEIFGIDLSTEIDYLITSLVSSDAKAVRFAQAEGYLYYVDGVSPLRRINLTTMVAEDAIPNASDITVSGVDPTTLTAKEGASLIHFLNNRLFLSGFKDDPNLVITSLIDATKPRFDQYNDKFYSPDQSPELSTGSPITALSDISDYLVVLRGDGKSLYDYGAAASAVDSRQTTPYGADLGCESQECVTKANNSIYFYNRKNGLVRFSGSTDKILSSDISNLFASIKNPEGVSLVWDEPSLSVRIYCSMSGDTNDTCLYYYSPLEGRLPWYMDLNTPVKVAVSATDQRTIYGFHSLNGSVMEVDSQDTDYDSYIVMEYHTQYRLGATAEPSGYQIIRRLHLHELSGDRHSTYVAIDADHKDKPVVWRRFINPDTSDTPNPDAVFQETAQPGISVISVPMLFKCRLYQVRFKRYCYRNVGSVLGAEIEYDDQKPL